MPHALPTVTVAGLSYLDASPLLLSDLLRQQLLQGEQPLRIFTPNATIAAAAARDASLTALLRSGDLLLPDGRGVLIAARLAGRPLRYRLPGIEAGEELLQLCAEARLPVYLLGAAPGVARRAAVRIRKRLPTLPLAGLHHGYFDAEENDSILQDIRASGARALIVCLGFPAQERWIAAHADALPDVRVMMGLGGSLDVWSGDVRRAPALWQRMGLEWLWRSLHSPRRFRTLLPVFGYLFGRIGEKDTLHSQFTRQNPIDFFRKHRLNYAKRQK